VGLQKRTKELTPTRFLGISTGLFFLFFLIYQTDQSGQKISDFSENIANYCEFLAVGTLVRSINPFVD
jgi:hypothetical protein